MLYFQFQKVPSIYKFFIDSLNGVAFVVAGLYVQVGSKVCRYTKGEGTEEATTNGATNVLQQPITNGMSRRYEQWRTRGTQQPILICKYNRLIKQY